MRIRSYTTAAFVALVPTLGMAAEGSLRGSPASMNRQHDIAVAEELTFSRTPRGVLAEVAAGTLTPLTGNDDYRVADVSFAYAIPEVRLLVERLSHQYRAACNERLVVTSLTRPKVAQPRNSHVLSVHPAGMAVDLRISPRTACRNWLENTLLALENAEVLDVTRERHPPHYHIAVFPSQYREYVDRIDALTPKPVKAQPQQPELAPVTRAAIAALPTSRARPARTRTIVLVSSLTLGLIVGLVGLQKQRRRNV